MHKRIPTIFMVFFALLLWVTSTIVRFFKPLQRDEVEYLHTAWLISIGQQPFIDFFQHHSALFFDFLSLFATIETNLDWILHIRIFILLEWLSVPLFVNALVSIHAGVPFTRTVSISVPITFFIVGITTGLINIRSETLAIPLFLLGWILSYHLGSKKLLSAPVFALAIALTPRAVIPVSAIYLLSFFECAFQRRWKELFTLFFSAALGIVLSAFIIILPTGWEYIHDWMIRFNRNSGPPVLLWDALGPIKFSVVLVVSLVALQVVVTALLERRTLSDIFTKKFKTAMLVLIGLTFTFIEPRQFSQVLQFPMIAGAVLISEIIVTALSSKNRLFIPWLLLALMAIATPMASHLTKPKRNETIQPTNLQSALEQLPKASNIFESIEWRSRLCSFLNRQHVLIEPTQFHPIRVRDAVYFWHGGEYVINGTLRRAGLEAKYPFDQCNSEHLSKAKIIRILPVVLSSSNCNLSRWHLANTWYIHPALAAAYLKYITKG